MVAALPSLAAIFVVKAAIIALGAVYIRAQLAVHRGFDLALAAIALGAGELLIIVVQPGTGLMGWVAGVATAAMFGAMIGAGWSWIIARRFASEPSGASSGVLVASLGLATVLSGIVAAFRGPGLAQLPEIGGLSIAAFSPSMQAALVICGLGAIPVLAWGYSRAGFEAFLLDQDRTFAEELGCGPRDAALVTGLLCGVGAAAAGAANAILSGSTPTSGMSLFLQAAAAALLFPNRAFIGALGGALVVAGLYVGIGSYVTPTWADFFMFGIILLFLVIRGHDRTAEGLR